MKKNILLIILFILSILKINSQTITPSVINSAGGFGALGSTGIEVYYNIGEPIITTVTNGTNIITQGFLQPEIVGKFGLTATAFVSPTSCSDKTDGGIIITATVSGNNPSSSNLSYYWSPANVCTTGLNCRMVSNLPAGIYSVTVVRFNGALKVDSVVIPNLIITASTEPCLIKLFNGITPNGDGINDFFFIENIEQFKGNRVEIYNRWGQQLADIKEYDNINNNWNGTINNGAEIASSGTYFFIINLGNGTAAIKGWLELTSSK